MTPAWPQVRLDECCRIVSGATPSTSKKEFWEGDIRWATPKDLSELDGALISDTPRKITQAGLASCAAELLPPGTVLFSSRAPIGHVAINTMPMATNQGFKSFVPDAKRIYAKYLYWWLKANRPYLERLGNGATFKEVSKAVVSRINIPLPPLAEQRRIADVLDRAEELRSKRRTVVDKLNAFAHAIFLDLFGDPQLNPKQWPRLAFDDVCDTRLGKMLDGKQQTGRNSRPYLRNANVQWFRFDLDDVYEMDFDSTARQVFRLKPGDLLICEGGEPGRAAVWKGEIAECYYQKALHRARPKADLATPEYLAWLFRLLAERGALADFVTSATIAHLTGEKLKAMTIPLPPLAEQHEFVRLLGAVEVLHSVNQESADKLESLIASLQRAVFSGDF